MERYEFPAEENSGYVTRLVPAIPMDRRQEFSAKLKVLNSIAKSPTPQQGLLATRGEW